MRLLFVLGCAFGITFALVAATVALRDVVGAIADMQPTSINNDTTQ